MKAGGRSAAQHVPLAVARRGRRLARGLSQISMPHAYQRPPGASPAQPAGAGRSPCQRPARPPQRAATLPEALYISGADEPSRQRLIADPPLPPPPPLAAARTSQASGERFCWRAALAAAVQQTGWPIALAPRLRLVLLWGYRLPPLRPQLLLRVHMLRRAPLCCHTCIAHTCPALHGGCPMPPAQHAVVALLAAHTGLSPQHPASNSLACLPAVGRLPSLLCCNHKPPAWPPRAYLLTMPRQPHADHAPATAR